MKTSATSTAVSPALNRYILNIRASYFEETENIVGQMTGQALDKIAVSYQNNDYDKADLLGVERAMEREKTSDRSSAHSSNG